MSTRISEMVKLGIDKQTIRLLKITWIEFIKNKRLTEI